MRAMLDAKCVASLEDLLGRQDYLYKTCVELVSCFLLQAL